MEDISSQEMDTPESDLREERRPTHPYEALAGFGLAHAFPSAQELQRQEEEDLYLANNRQANEEGAGRQDQDRCLTSTNYLAGLRAAGIQPQPGTSA